LCYFDQDWAGGDVLQGFGKTHIANALQKLDAQYWADKKPA
jgi:hypothetical protein